ncbi:hypothetical protein ACH427_04140 [Streptomyces sp. NPDC020379]|uniref:hypothetical protein n=1 Tax=Streptomyces sp. NPDC020379 TaxID=3365071 RepID=UPI00378DE2D7
MSIEIYLWVLIGSLVLNAIVILINTFGDRRSLTRILDRLDAMDDGQPTPDER